MKLCKDCIHFGSNGRCQKQLVEIADYVNGGRPQVIDNWRGNCNLQREDTFFVSVFMNTCGQRGRFFKKKLP